MTPPDNDPESLRDLVPNGGNRHEQAELISKLMLNRHDTLLFAGRELSQVYRRVHWHRSRIDANDPEPTAAYAYESGTIDHVVGAYVVFLQREIVRLTDLYRTVFPSKSKAYVRDMGYPRLKTYTVIETIYQLANFFKHDEDLFACEG